MRLAEIISIAKSKLKPKNQRINIKRTKGCFPPGSNPVAAAGVLTTGCCLGRLGRAGPAGIYASVVGYPGGSLSSTTDGSLVY